MNRKGLVVLVALIALAVLAAGSAFAQVPEFKLSAGAGGYFTSDFGGGVELTPPPGEAKMPYAGGGGFAFFDATFAELSFGFFAAGGNYERIVSGITRDKFGISRTGLDISLLGKFPFALTEQFTLFPLLGITYRHFISAKASDPANLIVSIGQGGNLSALWFKLGAGADYAFTDHIFARLDILYGLRLANKYEKDIVPAVNPALTWDTRLGHGLDVKLAVGYRF
jgi:opacity protein-like surface antigen